MAQSIILKRSALPGKVPDTGSLNTGELAINTYDGKIFIKRSGNLDSIQSVVTTDSITTGSITLTQTASIGELVISQDANIQRDLFVIRDIITNNDIDAGGDISGSGLQVNDTLNIVHGQFNLSASTSITGAVGIDGDLTVLGAVNAQQFNINIISSSVIYQSGSSKFGDTIDDTHEFTGSIDVSGSIILNGIELGGSTNSGSFTGSFTGSFIGDGSGLRGVVSDELPKNGYDYNIDDVATINDFNATSSKYLIDFDIDAMIGTPIGHKTYIANFTGSTKVIPAGDSVRFHVHDVEIARIDENGFSGSINFPAGVVSGSSQLTSSYDTRYVLSGSITQTTWDNIASKPGGIVSGSSQLTSSYDLRYAASGTIGAAGVDRKVELYTATSGQTVFNTTGSASVNNVDVHINGFKLPPTDFVVTNSNTITLLTGSNTGELVEIALYDSYFGTYLTYTDLTSLNEFTTSNNITSLNSKTGSYATTGSNTFIGTQTLSGSILPAIDNTYDLGSATYQWRDIYVSSGSLYIDGTKVLGSTNQELQITTDEGQSIKILEAGSDSIILQSADGDIQLKSSGGGNLLFDPTTGLIDVRGTLQIQDGQKITSSGGNTIQFGNDIGITGSITTTGNVNGVNITTFSSSVSTQLLTIQTNTGSSNLRLTNLENVTGSYATTGSNTFFGTQTYSGSVYIANDLIVQGSSSIQYISASSVSIGTNIVQLNTANPSIRYAGLTITDSGSVGGSGSFLYDSVQDEFIFLHRGDGINITSSHFVLGPETYNDLGNETYLTNNRLPKGKGNEHLIDSNISDNGTLITLGSNTTITGTLVASGTPLVSGSSQISFTGIVDKPTLVSGSSQVDVMSTTNVARLATTGSNIFTGNQSITGSNSGLYLGGGNNRIYFSNYRALEGATDGTNLQVGEGYSKVILQSTSTQVNGNLTPDTNGTRDLGSASLRWANLYTNDLHLSNEDKVGGNDVDGTTGNWTIQEGEEHLYIINNKTGKKFKFSLEEIQ